MYMIRTTHGNLVEIELSGRMTTAEALRAVSQACALAETDGSSRAICDVRGVERGPGNLLLVAAMLAAHYRRGMRVALVARPQQLGLAQRFARYTGARERVGAFATPEAAANWLASSEAAPRISSTELRHLADLSRQWAPEVSGRAEDERRRSGAA
jgi:hypothetical protein